MKRIVWLLGLVLLLASEGMAARISAVTPSSNYQGSCPVTLTIQGDFRLNVPLPANYQFVFSDGVRLGTHRFTLMGRGQHSVSVRRKFTHNFNGWVKLRVATVPGGVRFSAPVPLGIRCTTSPSTGRGIEQVILHAPTPSALRCPGSARTLARIRHKARIEIRYSFVRDDGARSPWRHAVFLTRGVHEIQHRWNITHPVNTRYRIVIKYRKLGQAQWKTLHSTWKRFRVQCQPGAPLLGTVSLQAFPASYDGPCPKRILFSGKVRFNRAGTIRYRWERSDGWRSPLHTFHASHAGTYTLQTSWQLNHTLPQGWMRLQVVSPQTLSSPRATFHLRCRQQAPHILQTGIKVLPASYTGKCPVDLQVEGRFRIDRAGNVQYRFLRSDGVLTPVRTFHAPSAGWFSLFDRLHITRDSHGWVRLRILSPTPRTSAPASYRVDCKKDRFPVEAVIGTVGGLLLGEMLSGHTGHQPPSQGIYTPREPSSGTTAKPPVEPVPQSPATEESPSMDSDGDGISDTLENRLLERFRPYYLFAEGEKWLPSDAIYQLRHAQLRRGIYLRGASVLPETVAACRDLAADPMKLVGCMSRNGSPLQPSEAALDLNNTLRSDPGSGRNGDWDSAISTAAGLYGHVVPEEGKIRIEYWQFFPYAQMGNRGAHEGDWQLLSLLFNPESKGLQQVCHYVYGRKICFDLTRGAAEELGNGLVEYRGAAFSAPLPPINPFTLESTPPNWQNRAVRFYRAADGLHPIVYIARGSHAFWPLPEGRFGTEDTLHDGRGHAYLTALDGAQANLGELSRPLPSSDDPKSLILRFTGHWGAEYSQMGTPPYGPPLSCRWHFLPSERNTTAPLDAFCRYR
jgi:hypothetical protein